MPMRSKIDRLPADLREKIEERIVAQGYDNYDAIAADLQAQGHDITADNLYRHGRKLRTKIEQSEMETEVQRAFRSIKENLERSGIRLHGRDEPTQQLLMELGSLRLRERYILARLCAAADFAEVEPDQS